MAISGDGRPLGERERLLFTGAFHAPYERNIQRSSNGTDNKKEIAERGKKKIYKGKSTMKYI